jgi:YHS domain-containing protein
MKNRLATPAMTLSMALMLTSITAFSQTQTAGKPDCQKMSKAGCMADSMKKACNMKQAKADSCCKMKGEGVKCACQKAGKKCDGACKMEAKPCDAKADSMKKAHCMNQAKMSKAGCINDSLKKECGMNQVKMDSCCKMKGESAKCACQKAGKKCDGACKKDAKPCDAKADSMKKAHGMNQTKVKEAGKAAIQQKTCPVMGEPIDQSVYLDYQGKRIYFCCESCKAKFLKSPETYLKKIK